MPLETFFHYGLAFQRRFVPEVEDTQVVGLERSSDGYELRTAGGEAVTARSVVVAVGISHLPTCRRSWLACPGSSPPMPRSTGTWRVRRP